MVKNLDNIYGVILLDIKVDYLCNWNVSIVLDSCKGVYSGVFNVMLSGFIFYVE